MLTSFLVGYLSLVLFAFWSHQTHSIIHGAEPTGFPTGLNLFAPVLA